QRDVAGFFRRTHIRQPDLSGLRTRYLIAMTCCCKYICVPNRTTGKKTFMFERYTQKARRVIFGAVYMARRVGSPMVETEHLLLGLLREDKVLARRFLGSPWAA